MRKPEIITITVFFLISSLIFALLAFFSGSLYIPTASYSVSADTYGTQTVTVIIDAGHGGEDGGASSKSGLVEKNINLDISQQLRDLLISNNIKVIMTREDDRLLYDRNVDYQGRKKKLDLAARLEVMKKTENAIFISIHMNAFTDPKYSGLQVWYSQNEVNSRILADKIQSNNRKTLQPENTRKIKAATSSIFLLNEATCPAVLVECGFLSNQEEAAKFEGAEYRKELAYMLFCSINEFLSNEAG